MRRALIDPRPGYAVRHMDGRQGIIENVNKDGSIIVSLTEGGKEKSPSGYWEKIPQEFAA